MHNEIWFMFKIMQITVGMGSIYLHVVSFMDKDEPFEHTVIHCATYFTFTMLAAFGVFAICFKNSQSPYVEVLLGICGFTMYFVSTCMIMRFIEHDSHLQYLASSEEPYHPMFMIGRKQAILGLVSCIIYLLHGLLALDVILYTEDDRTKDISQRPIKLYIVYKPWVPKVKDCFLTKRIFDA